MSMTPCVVCGEEVETDHCTINVCKKCCRANKCPCHSMCEVRNMGKLGSSNGWKVEVILDCIREGEIVDNYELAMRVWAKHRAHLNRLQISSTIYQYMLGKTIGSKYLDNNPYRRKVYWRIEK